MIAVTIAAAPHEYQLILTNEQLRMGDALTLNDLKVVINAY